MKLTSVNPTTGFEDELLICCARVSQSEEIKERLAELLTQEIDWQTVVDRSWWHRIRPLTYRHLSSLSEGLVPPAFLQLLAGHVAELEQRNQRLMEGQLEVSAMFQESSLPMLAFKGPTLAVDAYGDLSLRECGDLDMLIRPDDFPRVKEMLIVHGFDCLWDRVASERKRQLFACEFQRKGIELDVHWDLAPTWHNYRVDFDRFWASGEPIAANLDCARKLSPEDALEVLCMHGTRHWWDRLRWICDIAELLNRGRIIDWDRVEAGASEANCHRSVWLGVWLAVDLLGAKPSPEIQDRLDRTPVIKRLASQVGDWLSNAENAAESRKLPDRFLFRMRLCERWRDRLPQLANYLMTLPKRSSNRNP